MKSFKTHTSEGTFTSGMIKSLGFMLRNKLSQKIKSGKASKDLSQKLDVLLDAQGLLVSIGIMNIGMEDLYFVGITCFLDFLILYSVTCFLVQPSRCQKISYIIIATK